MSKFVNFKKRSVALPPGCKDLIDLLQPHRPGKTHSISPAVGEPTIRRDESGAVRLSEIEKYVAMPFQSEAQTSNLLLSLCDNRLTVQLSKISGTMMSALALFEEDADRERRMREFFRIHHLQDPPESGQTDRFVPGVPVQVIHEISPLPMDAIAASKLVGELFRHVCRLTGDSPLTFRYYEVVTSR